MGRDQSGIRETAKPQVTVRTAQRVNRRVLDLVAISLIAITGLTAGREIVGWWRASATDAPAAITDPQVGWSERPLEIRYGESSSYARIPFHGTADAAIDQLLHHVQRRSTNCVVPRSTPTSEESAWCEELQKLTPRQVTESALALYVVPLMFPSVAALHHDDANQPRLAGWGWALPAGDDAWTLLIVSPDDHPDRSISLPDRAAMLLGWQDEHGQAVQTFQGPGTVDDWLAHFERLFGPVTDRRSAADGSLICIWRRSPDKIELHLSSAGDQMTGLLWLTTASPGQNRPTDN